MVVPLIPIALAAFWVAPEIGVAVPWVIGGLVAAAAAIMGLAQFRTKPKHVAVKHDPATDVGSGHWDMATTVAQGIASQRSDVGAIAFSNVNGYHVAFPGVQGEDWGITQYFFEDAGVEGGQKQYLIVWGKGGTITYKNFEVSKDALAMSSNIKMSQAGTGDGDDHTLWFPGSEQQ